MNCHHRFWAFWVVWLPILPFFSSHPSNRIIFNKTFRKLHDYPWSISVCHEAFLYHISRGIPHISQGNPQGEYLQPSFNVFLKTSLTISLTYLGPTLKAFLESFFNVILQASLTGSLTRAKPQDIFLNHSSTQPRSIPHIHHGIPHIHRGKSQIIEK